MRDLFQAPREGKFGLFVQSGEQWAIIRWTAEAVEIYLGNAVPEKEVVAVFK